MSRAGEIGMSFTQDAIGPIARTTEDARKVFDVISGFWDVNDNVTAVIRLLYRIWRAANDLRWRLFMEIRKRWGVRRRL